MAGGRVPRTERIPSLSDRSASEGRDAVLTALRGAPLALGLLGWCRRHPVRRGPGGAPRPEPLLCEAV